ncbi:LeuA family protein [Pseudodesulfovibrio sp.]|uniref:LeuA family protein n=1 Tax=unclassified Pseudodesulfovibrio TaxID=2661612 RepID=UPI003B010091
MLLDTTLREGAQLFGAYFTTPAKDAIVSGLLALGIDELEIGWVGQDGLLEFIRSVRPRCGQTKLSVWTPCRETDIRAASVLGVDRVNIGVPVSEKHMAQRLDADRDTLKERLASTVLTAKLMGISYISVGLEDISRADRAFALETAKLAAEMGASRVRLADSLGLLTPLDTADIVRTFRAELDIDLAVHCHDDFGMATANAITALASGADYADVSVLGIGERSGIAATEELAAHITLREEATHGYCTEAIRDLCDTVSQAAGIPIPRTKAVAGKDIFACESGIHAHALTKSPALFEPYNPDRIGANRTVAVGGKSGRAAIADALSKTGMAHQDHDIPALLQAVREHAHRLRRPLTPDEFARLARTAGKDLPC